MLLVGVVADDTKLFLQLAEWSEGIPRSKYQLLRDILQEHGIRSPSLRKKEARLRRTTGIEPRLIDCCYNNCIAYTGRYHDSLTCPFCEEPRSGPLGKARKQFSYIPL